MATNADHFLRRQIAEAFRNSSREIDQRVAKALAATGKFYYRFNSEELAVVFANVLHTLVGLQKFAGVSVPLVHNVSQVQVDIRYPRITVQSLLHIHSPIKAFIDIDYALANSPSEPGCLTLADHSLLVRENTRRFDLVAKAALTAIDIEGLVERELQDPAEVIRQTLPHRLKAYGFHGEIRTVRVEVTPDNYLDTLLSNS